jgi:hypothetical protein
MKRWQRGAVAIGSAVWVLGAASSWAGAQALPPQASPVAIEHTHGPDGLELDRRGRPGAAATYEVDNPAPWSALDYDGMAPTTDQPDGARAGLPMFHAIYLYPSDKHDYPATRFATYAAMFQADARDASKLLETLYGRAIRFDERTSVLGKPMLDITVVRSQYTSKQLAGANQWTLVNNDVTAKFNAPSKKYVVWLDAGSQYCGQGNLTQDSTRSAANGSEGRALAIVYRPYTAYLNDGTTGGFCRGRTARHEMGHTMGALQSVAPHAFDGAHCNDSGEDTMCYTSATTPDTGGPAFDYNNDDYWDPAANPSYGALYPATAPNGKLGWWTVNLSSFLCNTPTSCDVRTSAPAY